MDFATSHDLPRLTARRGMAAARQGEPGSSRIEQTARYSCDEFGGERSAAVRPFCVVL
jgi:hypothetical protein